MLRPPATLIPPAVRDWLGARLSGPPRGPRTPRGRTCVFALGWIGDFVLALSALRLVVRHYGEENCLLIISPAAAFIARREFPGIECLVLPADTSSLTRDIVPIWWRERRPFAAERFTRRICFSHQRPLYYEIALSWIDAGTDWRLMPETYPPVTDQGLSTELLAHWRLVETVLGRAVDRAEILPRFESLAAGDDGRLLVHPLSRDVRRDLAVEPIIAVLRLWREHHAAAIVFGGNPADAARLAQYVTAARAAGLTDIHLESPAGIDGLLAQVAAAGGVLAAESATAHIAGALDKPCVTIMGPEVYGYCQPWSRSARQHFFLTDTPAFVIAAVLSAR